MKYKIWPLCFWYFIVYMVFIHQNELIDGFDYKAAFSWLFEPARFVLFVTNALSFFVYSLCAYTIFYFLYTSNKKYFLIPMMGLCLLTGIGSRYIIQELLQKAIFGFGNYFTLELMYYIMDNLYYGLIFSAFGIIFYFIEHSKFEEGRRNDLILANKQSELSLLRSQVNPHFLFNTLNNIYTLVYHKSDDALSAVERLTGLLRYALYEEKRSVPISKEVKAIRDFIDLQKIRYSFSPALDLSLDGNCEGLEIAPFLLIPLVENAFKHGVLKDKETPVLIHLICEEGGLFFRVENKIARQYKDQVGGIGLENVKKRLDLIYGNRYEMNIEEKENNFKIALKLPSL